MKSLIILVCVVVVNVQAVDVLREMLGSAIEECKDKVQATPEDISQILQHQPITSTPGKCFVACLGKKFKIESANGKMDAKATREMVKLAKYIGEDSYQKLTAVVDTCLGQVHEGDNECDVAYNFYTCIVNESVSAKLPLLLGDLLR